MYLVFGDYLLTLQSMLFERSDALTRVDLYFIYRIFIRHTTSHGGYNVFALRACPSASQSFSPLFSQRNSSETAQQNFVKLCGYMVHDV